MQNLNEIKYIDRGGQLQVVEPISEYISTSEVVDANFSLTSSSTLRNLAGQILLTPTKIQRVSGMNGGVTLEQVMRLVPSPSDSDIPTGVCTYLFKVISMPYNAMSTDSTSDALIQVFYYYDATFIATCIIAAGATSTTKSDWVDIAKLSAEDVATINTSADVIFQNPQNTSETANSEFRFLTSGKNDNAMPYGIAINSSGIRWIVGGSEYGYFLTTDGPNSNVKTINGESIYGSGDIAISGGGEYANTSETVGIDSVITLTSTSTLADLGTQILANKTKTISCDINMGNDTTTRTRFCSLIGTPFAAPLGRYIVRVIAASVRPTIEITYSYYSWSSKTATRYLCQGTDGTLNVGSNWWLSDWITPASAVSENKSTLLTTGQSASGFWNNSQNPSITTIILNGDASVSFQGTPYGTDIRIVIFYFHPKGSYDDDPTNLAFDFAVMSDSGLWSYAYNKHNVGFTITATSSAVSYNYYTIA